MKRYEDYVKEYEEMREKELQAGAEKVLNEQIWIAARWCEDENIENIPEESIMEKLDYLQKNDIELYEAYSYSFEVMNGLR